MKTKVTAAMIASIVLAVSFCAADSPTNASGSDSMARLREELQQTQALVKQLSTRTARLEQRVRALEDSRSRGLEVSRRRIAVHCPERRKASSVRRCNSPSP